MPCPRPFYGNRQLFVQSPSLPLFTGVRGIGILRSSSFGDSRKFTCKILRSPDPCGVGCLGDKGRGREEYRRRHSETQRLDRRDRRGAVRDEGRGRRAAEDQRQLGERGRQGRHALLRRDSPREAVLLPLAHDRAGGESTRVRGLFTEVRGIGILRTSPFGNSAK